MTNTWKRFELKRFQHTNESFKKLTSKKNYKLTGHETCFMSLYLWTVFFF